MTQRKGSRFGATFHGPRFHLLVTGTIIGNKVQWLDKDYRQVKAPHKGNGGRGHDHFGTIKKENGTYKIDFEYHRAKDGDSGSYTFFLRTRK